MFTGFVLGQELDLEIHPDYLLNQYNLGQEEGLRGNLPHSLVEDQKGYIWLIVNNYVQRYNGTRFETFWKAPNSSGNYLDLKVDAQGRIWVIKVQRELNTISRIHLTGLWVIFPDTRTVMPLEEIWEWQNLDFDKTAVSAIANIGSDYLPIFGLANGKIVDPAARGKVLLEDFPETVSELSINSVGMMAVKSECSLTIFDKNGSLLTTYPLNEHIREIKINRKGDIIFNFYTNKRLYYIPFQGKLKHIGSDYEQEFYLPEDGENSYKEQIYISSNSVFSRAEKNGPILHCNNCPDLFRDRQGNIWTSDYNGLTVFQVQKTKFKTLLTRQQTEMRGILPVNDSMLVAHSFKGNFLLDLRDSVYKHNTTLDVNIGIAQDHSGRIWQGTYDRKIQYIPDFQQSLSKINFRDTVFIDYVNHTIMPFVDSRDQLWFGAEKGACFCPRQAGGVPAFCNPVNNTLLQKASVHHLEEVGGLIWAATSSGIFEIDPDTRQVVKHHEALAHLSINHFVIDGKFVWLSTFDSGLIKWEYDSHALKEIPLGEGAFMEIPSFCAIYDDGLGYLWLPSNDGLYRFHKEQEAFQRYGVEQHIAHNEFNYYSHARLPDGKLAFGGLNGITIVDPKFIFQRDQQEPLYHLELAEAFVINGENKEKVMVQNHQPIRMIGQQEDLEINCYLQDYRSKQKGRIIYKLHGLHQKWITLVGETLHLERLPFGEYTLEVKAITFDNLTNGNHWVIPIFVLRPWYRQAWFMGLLLLAGGALITYRFRIIRRANHRLEKIVEKRTAEITSHRDFILTQNQKLRSLNHYRSKIMAIIGHDLRGPIIGLSNMNQKSQLLLSSGQIDRLYQLFNKNDNQLEHLRTLVDNILAWSLVEDNKKPHIDRPGILLAKVVEDQLEIVQSMAVIKNQELELEVTDECWITQSEFVIGVLIRNILTNSIRYNSNNQAIEISVFLDQGQPSVLVVDQGPGMEPQLMELLNRNEETELPFESESQEGLGLGLWICNTLLRKLNGRWHFSLGENNKGLKVQFWF